MEEKNSTCFRLPSNLDLGLAFFFAVSITGLLLYRFQYSRLDCIHYSLHNFCDQFLVSQSLFILTGHMGHKHP